MLTRLFVRLFDDDLRQRSQFSKLTLEEETLLTGCAPSLNKMFQCKTIEKEETAKLMSMLSDEKAKALTVERLELQPENKGEIQFFINILSNAKPLNIVTTTAFVEEFVIDSFGQTIASVIRLIKKCHASNSNHKTPEQISRSRALIDAFLAPLRLGLGLVPGPVHRNFMNNPGNCINKLAKVSL